MGDEILVALFSSKSKFTAKFTTSYIAACTGDPRLILWSGGNSAVIDYNNSLSLPTPSYMELYAYKRGAKHIFQIHLERTDSILHQLVRQFNGRGVIVEGTVKLCTYPRRWLPYMVIETVPRVGSYISEFLKFAAIPAISYIIYTHFDGRTLPDMDRNEMMELIKDIVNLLVAPPASRVIVEP